jgi:hypothetical protein
MSTLTSTEMAAPPTVPLRAYFAYFLVGAVILFFCLFPPTWLNAFVSQLPWRPADSKLNYSTYSPPSPTPMATTEGKPLCYAWTNLSAEDSRLAQDLLNGNTSVTGVTSTVQPAKVGLAAVMPADPSKRTVLAKLLTDNKVDLSNVLTLSNGNRAWAIGVFTTEAMATELKSTLTAKGAWNLVTESRPPSTSVQFSTASAPIVTALSNFSKQHEWPDLAACK